MPNGRLIRQPVYDLPQMYSRPKGADILKALELLETRPRSFSIHPGEGKKNQRVVETGVSQYLTSIISSSLSWLQSDEVREAVWDAASARLSERSGRTGRGFAV